MRSYMYDPAVQMMPCITLVYTYKSNSQSTVVHVMYYTANVDGRLAEKAATRTAAVI